MKVSGLSSVVASSKIKPHNDIADFYKALPLIGYGAENYDGLDADVDVKKSLGPSRPLD